MMYLRLVEIGFRFETGKANPTLTMIHALADSVGVPIQSLFEPAEQAQGSKRLTSLGSKCNKAQPGAPCLKIASLSPLVRKPRS